MSWLVTLVAGAEATAPAVMAATANNAASSTPDAPDVLAPDALASTPVAPVDASPDEVLNLGPKAWDMLTSTEGIVRFVVLVTVEIAVVVLLAVTIGMLASFVLRRFAAMTSVESVQGRLAGVGRTLRRTLAITATLLIFAALGYDLFVVYQGQDAVTATIEQIREVPRDAWLALGFACAQVLGVVIAAVVFNRSQRRALVWLEAKVNAWDKVEANDKSLNAFCTSLANVLANTAWLLVLWFAVTRLPLPDSFESVLLRGITIYLTIAVGLLVVRITAVVVETIDALSRRVTADTAYQSYYDHLRSLVPLLRRCVEYALWLAVGTLVLYQLEPIAALAAWGPRLMQAIGVFFIGRVVVALGFLLIGNAMVGDPTISDTERRRRQTIEPLVKGAFKSVAYFIAFVLMLAVLGFNPLPFLAGAGIIGVVIGLGAQPLINDVVSGFFILFENLYLVGDFIEVGSIRGTVEAIDFRTTRIRDVAGNLHIVRNGDLREIANYCKGFTHAVVDVKVPYDSDIKRVFAELEAAGADLAAQHTSVQGVLEVRGVMAFDDDGLEVRTVTKVEPATHFAVAAALRLIILERFAAAGIAMAGERMLVTLRQES
ncbi:MAG: mechanosensitive ion channel family protein [Planctomycetota bacterium]|nr:mechanosensitive ion channel family protein [Planctomycetota bacterium]